MAARRAPTGSRTQLPNEHLRPLDLQGGIAGPACFEVERVAPNTLVCVRPKRAGVTPADLAELIKSRRIPMAVTAPPQGLFLVKVLY